MKSEDKFQLYGDLRFKDMAVPRLVSFLEDTHADLLSFGKILDNYTLKESDDQFLC